MMNNPFEEINSRLDSIECLMREIISKNNVAKIENNDKKKLLKIDEAAELTGYKKGYIYELVFRKAIPFIKRGRSIRFDPSELDDWMREGRPNVIKLGIKSLKNHIK